jgi:hypothetical protein
MHSGFSPGSTVRARGRDWIVLPGREPSVLRLRRLTRGQADEIGIYLPLEGREVTSAEFAPPAVARPGDATGVIALFNAARLSLRSGAAPFRSLGRISVNAPADVFAPSGAGESRRSDYIRPALRFGALVQDVSLPIFGASQPPR